jgi:glycosyltransferase involved in cell wall biosynthesis
MTHPIGKMSHTGISVIIPVYNGQRYLREAIDSALHQTLPPQQIIVVDDGSTDDSGQIARSYATPVTVVTQETRGTSGARNRGLIEATGAMIAFLDADDRYLPRKLEHQAHVLADQPAASMCICQVSEFWSPEEPDPGNRPVDQAPQFRLGQAGTWLVRREAFDRIGAFNVTPQYQFAEGSEWFSRIEAAGLGVARTERMLIERRLHASNKTNDSKAHLDGIMALMKRRIDLRRDSA